MAEVARDETVPGIVSRRVAGIWFIWFLRSGSCVWLDGRQKKGQAELAPLSWPVLVSAA